MHTGRHISAQSLGLIEFRVIRNTCQQPAQYVVFFNHIRCESEFSGEFHDFLTINQLVSPLPNLPAPIVATA